MLNKILKSQCGSYKEPQVAEPCTRTNNADDLKASISAACASLTPQAEHVHVTLH